MAYSHAVDFTNGSDSANWAYSIATATATVTAATQATNCQITTSTPHGLGVGDHIIFRSIGGMTQLNSGHDFYETGTVKRVYSVIDDYNFTLDIDSSAYSAYTSGGTMRHIGAQRCTTLGFRIGTHSLVAGDIVYITSVSGMTQVNNTAYYVKVATPNAIIVGDIVFNNYVDSSALSGYSTGGTSTTYFKKVTAITKANPAVISCKGHGLSNGQIVYLSGGDMTEISERAVTVANKTDDTFEASGIDSTAYTTYTGGCILRRPFATVNALCYTNGTVPEAITDANNSIKIIKSAAATHLTSADCTWAIRNNVINTTASYVGTISVGDLVARVEDAGNGNPETWYKVTAVTSTTITVENYYWGPSGGGTDTASLWHRPLTTATYAQGITNQGIIINNKNMNISGGWNDDFTAQDGETWLRHAVSESSSSHYGCYTYAGEISKINVLDCYCNFYLNGTGTLQNCTGLSSLIYNFYRVGQVYVFDCVASGTSSTNYASVYDTAGVPEGYWDGLYIWNGRASASTGYCLYLYNTYGEYYLGDTYVVCGGEGIRVSVAGLILHEPNLDYCYYGFSIQSAGSNFHIINPSITNQVSGGYNAQVGALVYEGLFEECDFGGTSVLINVIQSRSITFKKCTFANMNYGVWFDQYSGSATFEECDFQAPNNYGIYCASVLVNNILVRGCTIDAPSIAKAYNQPAGDSVTSPIYIFENSFGVSGKLYGRLSALSDATVYHTTGPSLKITVNSNANNNRQGIEILSEWAKSGVARTWNLKMKRDTTAFVGTITPIWFLNGIEKTTLSDITSLSTSWTDYSFNCPNTDIDADGRLELRFKINGNATAFWIDEFEAVNT